MSALSGTTSQFSTTGSQRPQADPALPIPCRASRGGWRVPFTSEQRLQLCAKDLETLFSPAEKEARLIMNIGHWHGDLQWKGEFEQCPPGSHLQSPTLLLQEVKLLQG